MLIVLLMRIKLQIISLQKNEGMLLHNLDPHLLSNYDSQDCVKTFGWFLSGFEGFMGYFVV